MSGTLWINSLLFLATSMCNYSLFFYSHVYDCPQVKRSVPNNIHLLFDRDDRRTTELHLPPELHFP